MKKILIFLFLLSLNANAQYTIKGKLNPLKKYSWVILYKVQGGKQKFVKNTKIKKDTVKINGIEQIIGTFEFTLPADAPAGFYRATYKTKGSGYVDFLFDNENVSFEFDPQHPTETVFFTSSEKNILYKNYETLMDQAQYEADSLQMTYINSPVATIEQQYKDQLLKINQLQNSYLKKTEKSFLNQIIKAYKRYNSPTIIKDKNEYLKSVNTHFFDYIDFNNKELLQSSFFINKIVEYIFYINYSDDKLTQEKLIKSATKTVLEKIENVALKTEVLEFLVSQFVNLKDVQIVDYLMDTFYEKLPDSTKKTSFKNEISNKTSVEIGRIAPEIIWNEKGKKYALSTLNEAENYLLIFWSTGCSHCTRELPLVRKHLETNKNVKVIAFALENDKFTWENYILNFPNWHHVLGLKKWENAIAKTYQVHSTPTYMILNSDKKIIAKPHAIKDLYKEVELLKK